MLSKDRRSLMLAYILVLAVRVEPGAVLEAPALEGLADELKMRPADLAARYRELGCVDTSSTTVGAGGSLPLGFLIVSTGVGGGGQGDVAVGGEGCVG